MELQNLRWRYQVAGASYGLGQTWVHAVIGKMHVLEFFAVSNDSYMDGERFKGPLQQALTQLAPSNFGWHLRGS